MRTHALAFAVAIALASAGCIQSMDDLKDRVGADEPVQPAAVDETPTVPSAPANTTPKVTKPPVARVAVFGANNALVFKSTFQADDPADAVYVTKGTTLNLMASDSEALEPGATLAAYAWALNGKALAQTRTATLEVKDAGLYVVTLNVTDSNGRGDEQTVKLAVAPEPYDVVTELVTGPIVGAESQGQPGELSFDLALPTDKPATAQKMSIVAAPGATCDATLEVTDPAGTSSGLKDDGGFGGAEGVEITAPAAGAYAIVVGPFACVAPDGVPVTVTVTFLPIVEGVAAGGDGHGHAH